MNTKADSNPVELSTIGYEGRTPEEFINLLVRHGVAAVIDVRQRAGSRKRGFAKTALTELLTRAGIAYVHLPTLGVPQDLRQQLREGDIARAAYLRKYRRDVEQRTTALAELERLIAERHCCLLCLEGAHHDCHRSCLADLLAQRSMQPIVVRHL